jgi:hypothetical protein
VSSKNSSLSHYLFLFSICKTVKPRRSMEKTRYLAL